jgi:tetratricopeptide (TPR) repeat protein
LDVQGIFLIALLAAAPKLSPEAKARTRELTLRSIREYNLGKFDQALKDAEDAYEISGLPALLFNLGQCHRAMGHWAKAEFFYRNYLRDNPRARNQAEVTELLAQMRAKAAAQANAPPGTPAAAPAPPPVATVPPPSDRIVSAVPAELPPTAVQPPAVEKAVPPRGGPTWMTWLGGALVLGSGVGFYYAGFGLNGASIAQGYEHQASAAQQSFYQGSASGLQAVGYSGLAAGVVAVAVGATLIAVDLTHHPAATH